MTLMLIVGLAAGMPAAAAAFGPDEKGWSIVNQQIISSDRMRSFDNVGKTGGWEACRALCDKAAACTAFDWSGATIPFENKSEPCGSTGTCWLNSHGVWDPHRNGYCNHTSGLKLADTTTPRPGTCSGTVQCHEDSDCSHLPGCTWCRDDTPGVGHTEVCGGAPDADACGTLPGPAANASRLQYGVFGDSVSKGIFRPLSQLAAGWECFHPSANEGGGCGNTVRGVDCTTLWLDGNDTATHTPVRQWDVLTYNYGLHDLAQDGELVTVEAYKQNLRNISVRMQQAPGSPRLFWVTSTPVPDVPLGPPRNRSDVPL